MALKLKNKLKAKSKVTKPVDLSIDQIREQYDFGTFERAAGELKELASYADRARELTNAKNRQSTQATKAFKALALAEDLTPDHEILVGDKAYKYDYARSEGIPAEKLYELVTKKKITLEQFLGSVYVTKEQAKLKIGEHILMTIADEKVGKTMDLRSRDLDKPVLEPTMTRGTKKPPKGAIRRVNEQAPAISGGGRLKNKRKMKLRR